MLIVVLLYQYHFDIDPIYALDSRYIYKDDIGIWSKTGRKFVRSLEIPPWGGLTAFIKSWEQIIMTNE